MKVRLITTMHDFHGEVKKPGDVLDLEDDHAQRLINAGTAVDPRFDPTKGESSAVRVLDSMRPELRDAIERPAAEEGESALRQGRKVKA